MFRAEMLKRLLQQNRPTAAQNDLRSNVGYQGDKRTRSTQFELFAL
jgi:hypothetical protein